MCFLEISQSYMEVLSMGEGLLHFYRTKLKKEYKFAFVSTFLIAMLIHIYKFVNTLPNHDSVYNYYSDQNVLGSGRWALSFACGISSYYDLPWIIGLFSCIFIALTVVVIVALFKMKNPVLIALTGALLAASPATTETFFFLFTADGYMLSMFLAAVAVYYTRIEETRKSRWLFGGACISVSCGIYQSYVSFALVLAVCYFMDVLLDNRHSKEDCFKWVLRQVILYGAALAAYFVIWKLCMHFSGTVANIYQGISEVGKISVGLLVNGLKESIETTVRYFVQWDVFKHGFSLYAVLNLLVLGALAVGLVQACLKSGLLKRTWALVLLVLCLVALIPFGCMWHFVSEYVVYRAMMLQCCTLIFVLTALLFEKWAKKALAKDLVCLLLALTVFNNGLMANICYFYMHFCYERSYAEGVEMMMDIHDLQGEYEFDKMTVIGSRYKDVQLENTDPETGEMLSVGNFHILSRMIEKTLLFDGIHIELFLKGTYGLDLDLTTIAERDALLATEEVQTMPIWPADGSIAVVDDILVIKLSDLSENQ